ncbi:asparaginase [Amycolatopsis sp. FDAARGOS 1241]|uniref:asparaginase n=1 Tax=Amycolatopsis sp. FDAARGOS 1241 TaxID=2778070 RepID=UPI0019515E86|nr:asparaginase [Amycolatopsis sp. FDAARGOS 1241]QRP50491.1 asparaginase [Amycolatopsis sp. FDAARGOS 1241]
MTTSLTSERGEHVVLLATGGTISSRSRAELGGAAVASDGAGDLLRSTGGTHPLPVRVVDVLRVGSYTLDVDDMLLVCARIREALADPSVVGVVVTHGTDTMEETAFLADLVHADPRPVVFTGAQRAADAPAPDGPGNLARALALAGAPATRDRGVLVCFAGEVFPARGVRKSETLLAHAFSNPDDGRDGWAGDRPEPLPLPDGGTGCRVDLVASYPGADAAHLRASLAAGAAGIVVQGTGIGNANPKLCEAVAEATAGGAVVVTSTRVHAGPVVPVYGAGGGKDLLAAGAIPAGLLRPSQSLVLLSLLLRLGWSRDDIAAAFAGRGGEP